MYPDLSSAHCKKPTKLSFTDFQSQARQWFIIPVWATHDWDASCGVWSSQFSMLVVPLQEWILGKSSQGFGSLPYHDIPYFFQCSFSVINCRTPDLPVFESLLRYLQWCGYYLSVSMEEGENRIFLLCYLPRLPNLDNLKLSTLFSFVFSDIGPF